MAILYRRLALGTIAGFVAGAVFSQTSAHGLDLHRWWDTRCGDCHGRAASFAREFLTVSNGKLEGQHPNRDMRLFLGNHGVPKDEVDAVYNMLLTQRSSEPKFQERCSKCHGSAAQFARDAVERQGGVLVGRASKRSVRDFLKRHAGLSSEEAEFFAGVLERVEGEVRTR